MRAAISGAFVLAIGWCGCIDLGQVACKDGCDNPDASSMVDLTSDLSTTASTDSSTDGASTDSSTDGASIDLLAPSDASTAADLEPAADMALPCVNSLAYIGNADFTIR